MLRWVVALVAVCLSMPSAWAQSAVTFPSIAVSNSPAGPTIKGWLYRPSAGGPTPAVIYGHPCSGLDSFTETWTKRLASWGYLVLAPDSYGARGINNACMGGMPANNLVSDVAGALDFLAKRPDVIKGKVAIVGNSTGGKLALRAVQKRFGLAGRGLVGGVGLYLAPCSAPQDKYVDLPFLALLAEKDDWTSVADCHAWADAAPRPLVQSVFYPGAAHGFDNGVLLSRAVPCGRGTCHIGYDAKVAADAEAQTRAFLQSLFGR